MSPVPSPSPTAYQAVLNKVWWQVEDVMVYLGKPSTAATRTWFCRTHCQRAAGLTCREWVDEAVRRQGAEFAGKELLRLAQRPRPVPRRRAAS